MSGRGAIDASLDANTQKEIVQWTKDAGWQMATHPLHHQDFGLNQLGPGIAMAKKLHLNPDYDKIGLIPAAFGGSPISSWQAQENLYVRAVQKAQQASESINLAAIIWQQGESDVLLGQEVTASYFDNLLKLIANFRKDLNQEKLPFFLGGLGDDFREKHPLSSMVQDAFIKAAGQMEQVYFIDAAGLKNAPNDPYHFSAASYRALGERYADAYEGSQD